MSNQVHLIEQRQDRVYEYPEEDPQYQGANIDLRIKKGPLNDRGCKDIIFVFIYTLLWGLMGYIAYYALQNGNPSLLLSPFDIYGNHCGYGVTKAFPYVYIVDVGQFYCVSHCPSESGQQLPCYNCQIQSNYASNEILTLCYPTTIPDQEKISDLLNFNGAEKYFSDLEATWQIIVACAFIGLFISLILTCLIKMAAYCIVWGMIIIYLLILSALGGVAYLQATTTYFDSYKFVTNNDYLLGIAYTSWGIAAFSLLLIICLCGKINLAIAVLKAAADFSRDVCQAIFVPIGLFIVILAFFAFWIYISIYIYSSGPVTQQEGTPFFAIRWDTKNKYQLLVYLFGLFWNCELAIAFCQFVIASACCMWYFSHMGNQLSSPISKSIVRGLCHHLGSLLLGSLILAIVQIIKFLLEQIHKTMKQTLLNDNVADNNCMKCGFTYCKCLIKYFEKFIRFLNQNAYIMIALTGKNFCSAAHDAFYLIFRNALKVAVTHGLGQIFEFIGTLFITAITSLICYLIITEVDYFSKSITSPLAPTIVFIIISFVVGCLFMNIYGMGTDTILLCYLADLEVHQNEGGAKSIPNTLKEFLREYA